MSVGGGDCYLIETTSQSLATAALHILLPRKPLPPHTTSFFFAACAATPDMSCDSRLCNGKPMAVSCLRSELLREPTQDNDMLQINMELWPLNST